MSWASRRDMAVGVRVDFPISDIAVDCQIVDIYLG